MSRRKLMGMVLAVMGMMAYGYFNSKPQPAADPAAIPAAPAAAKTPESSPLLPTAAHKRLARAESVSLAWV
jgi:hypothetical protein